MSGMFNVSNTYDYMNSFFGNSTNNNNNIGGFNTSLLSDLYSVQNGTYLKVAKKFYSDEAVAKREENGTADKNMELAKSSSESAVSSLNKLMSDDLFKKVSKTDEEGNTTYDYDREEILDTLKNFVDDYNDLIKNIGEVDGEESLRAGVNMVKQLKYYQANLSRAGISIESDNTLKIDEDAFMKSDMTDMKNLFTGSVSFGKNLQTKLMAVHSAASQELNSVNGLYSAQGVKNASIGSMFDSLL